MSPPLRRVLYHHRTQGKAVEGVHIRGITDALRAEGVVVDIVSLPGADPYATPKAMSPTRQATGLMKLVSSLPEPLFEAAEIAYNAVAGWRVGTYLFRHDDVDLLYERYSLFMFAGVMMARWRRVPVVLEVNDSATVERVRPLSLRWLATRIERWTLRNADGLVFVSGVFRDRVAEAHGGIAPSIVAPNAANLDKFSFTQEQRDAGRSRYGLHGHVVCGYLGAFVPWHAIDRFVYQIADRLAEAPHLKLLLVGDGANFETVRSFVHERGLAERIVLTGRVAHDDVPALLAAMDMAVLPSAGDYTSPVKLFEFMACAVPPVAPDFAPIREVLADDETGWLFKAGDLESAIDTVLLRSRDREALQRVGQAARAYIRDHRQWRHNILQLVEFRHQLAATMPERRLPAPFDEATMNPAKLFWADMQAKQRLYSANGTLCSMPRTLISDGTLANLLYRCQLALSYFGFGPLALLPHLLNKWINGCVIGVKARFGPGFVLIHPIGVVINSSVRGGRDVWLESSVVVGENRGRFPSLGDDVFVGSGAKIIGAVRIGDGARVGANAVVLHDVADGDTVVGIPARPLPPPRGT